MHIKQNIDKTIIQRRINDMRKTEIWKYGHVRMYVNDRSMHRANKV